MAKKSKPSKEKALEILHDGTIRGKKITNKQRKFFGYIANANIGIEIPNYNNSNVSLPPNFNGEGYKSENWNSPAWRGQFQLGGMLPGTTGFMYAREGAPSNGKYAKKTKASAQNGTNLYPVETWKKQGLLSADTLQRGTMYRVPYIDQKKLYNIPIPHGVNPNSEGFITVPSTMQNPNILAAKKKLAPSPIYDISGNIANYSHPQGSNVSNFHNGGVSSYYINGLDFKTKGMKKGGKIKHDNNGYWNPENWGHPVQIDSNEITMHGVNQPLLGVSDTGHSQMMYPNNNYAFNGTSVVEYPLDEITKSSKQDKGQLKKLDQLTDFSNNNNMEQGKSGIHINPKNKGKFNALKKRTGKTTEELTHSKNPLTRKRAVFAKNAKHWNHAQEGAMLNTPLYQDAATNASNSVIGSFTGGGGGFMTPQNYNSSTAYTPYQSPQQVDNSNNNQKNQLNALSGSLFSGVGNVLGGLKLLGQEKQQRKQAEQFSYLSNVVAQAATSRPEKIKRKYVRPEDIATQPNQLSPSYGVGTNYLSGKNGLSINGEIQNTYAPNTLYDDLGYEPLNDSNKVKQFQSGGEVQAAAQLWNQGMQLGQVGGGMLSGNPYGSPSAGSMIGSIGGVIPGLIGGALDQNPRKTNRWNRIGQANLQKAALQQGIQSIQTQNSSFMENGGWMSHDWQPQVITKFGDYSMKDLLKPDPTMNTLRSGGHLKEDYVNPSERALQTYALGGDLKTHWGGKARTMSLNPYLPDGGETVMFEGQSHEESDDNGNTGIGVTYGENPVEVERGEPAVKLQDGGTGEDNLVVFGNMKIPSYGVLELNDKNAKGKKFKNYISDLSEKEVKQNKVVEKGTKLVNNTNVNSPFNLLKMNSGKALIEGGNMKLKDIAKKKQIASMVQNAILDTAKEHNLDSDALSQGKIKKAKFGGKLSNYQQGGMAASHLFDDNGFISKDEADSLVDNAAWKYMNPKKIYKDTSTPPSTNKGSEDFNKWFAKNYDPKKDGEIKDYDGKPIKMTLGDGSSNNRKFLNIESDFNPIVPEHSLSVNANVPIGSPNIKPIANSTNSSPTNTPSKVLPWVQGALSALPYFRPTNQIGLDPNQLAGEMYALSANQLDPVQAQLYHPQLDQTYDVSLQDQLNANQSDFNALQRQTGYNPAAQSALAAQKYAANSGVLGEQFRLNQAQKAAIYSKNRDTLNDAQLKNLAILDQQYVRQAQAKSNTKAIAQSALSSIADKIQQNKLENRTLGIYENLYGYRFDPQGRAYNLNAPTFFNIPQIASIDDKKKSRNGAIVKAIKNL